MSKPHKHAALIHAWADGATIQYFSGNVWVTTDHPQFNLADSYRAKPERVFPVTSMTDDELVEEFDSGEVMLSYGCAKFRAIANAAIRRHIEDTESKEQA